MAELSLGDEILTQVEGKDEYTPVVAWLHRSPKETAQYLKLASADNEHIFISGKHNIGINQG